MQDLDPTVANIALWLAQLDPALLRDQGWLEISKRFPEITEAAPHFLQHHFKDDQKAAAYDGFTLALLAVAHLGDVQQLSALFDTQNSQKADTGQPTQP